MNAIAIGPFAFDASRLAAVAGFAIFLTACTIAARRNRHPDHALVVEAWAGWAVLAWILGARSGFVLSHARDFAAAPLDALKLWQGGFSGQAGWTAAGGVLLVALLKGRGTVLRPVLIAAALAFVIHQAMIAALPRPPMRLPQVELLTMEGRPVPMPGQGRVTVVNLWATWCPPCRREMPMMTTMAANRPEIAFVFANQGESAGRILDFLIAENLPPAGILRDPGQSLMARLRAVGLPSTAVFDAKGALVAAQMGEISGPALRAMIDRAKER